MREIPVEVLRQLIRYEPETGRLFWLERTPAQFNGNERSCRLWNAKWSGKQALNQPKDGYRVGQVLRVSLRAHRVAWALYYGRWPDFPLDHDNGVRSENWIKNLVASSAVHNGHNMRLKVTNTSGVCGVSLFRGRWEAKIKVSGRRIYLGRFDKKADAIAARRAAEIEQGFHRNHGRR